MKKILSIFCALVIAASLTACNNSAEPDSGTSDIPSDISDTSSESSDQSDDNSSSNTSSVIPAPAGENDPLPRMDGSTSAIPLEIGLRSGFLGIPYAQAKEMVSHTTTHDSFKRLINGEVDLIFSVPISAEQQKAADDAGVKLFMEPVAREGFVFVVNANNPVDSLTSDQLRKIYSGEITNWSQVGGNNEPILPYQRNTDSGSQNYMTVFMGDTPLLEPKVEFVAGGMSGIMDAVAVYDNSAGAIGYSVYSYAAQMYANANKVKFIAVDGVAPSKATMADESYPLLSCTYLIYTDKSPESAKEFVEKALSDEGQNYVLESGYLPVNGMEIPEKYLPYEAVGTGEPRPAGLKPSRKYSMAYLSVGFDDNCRIFNTGSTFELRVLKNKELEARINADISKAVEKLKSSVPVNSYWYDGNNVNGVHLYAICRNGYMSVILYTKIPDVYDGYNTIETLNYDLFSGKKIERFSDLFYKGEDFLPLINNQLAARISAEMNYYYSGDNAPKLDFSGILGEPRLFTIDSIGLDPDNLYFVYARLVDYTSSYEFNESDYLSLVSQYRDMTTIFEDKWADYVMEYPCDNEWKTKYVVEGVDTYLRFTGSVFHTAEEVAEQDKLWYELQHRAVEYFRKALPDYQLGGALYYGKNDNYYYISHHSADSDDIGDINFDADTLEVITLEMLIGKEWRQYLSEEDKVFGECVDLYPTYWVEHEDGAYINAFADRQIESVWNKKVYINVPKDKINKRYQTTQ